MNHNDRRACPARPAIATQEDAAPGRFGRGRLEVEVDLVEIVVGQPTEVDPTGEYEVLFDGANAVVGVPVAGGPKQR
jgi:hypothetical protein